MKLKPSLAGIAVGQVTLLAVLGWHFRHQLNTDAVAYIRIASYYADGKLALAVSGYWGPLLSWLIAGFLKLGATELVAARLAMSLSAVVFLWGCVGVFQSLQLSRHWCVIGAILAALAGAYWSALEITPDLLLAGIAALAAGRMCDNSKSGLSANAVTGLLWGLAYLTKAVALPLGLLTILSFAILDVASNRDTRSTILRHLLLLGVVFALVVAPWIAVLSLKYHGLTFSTAARISHTIAGPQDVDRYHPFARAFHRPEPGRITSWEDPSMASYTTWSPFEKTAYLRHQVKVIGRNLVTIAILMTSLNVGWWMLVAVFWPARSNPESRWVFARVMVIPVSLVLVYLPFSVLISQQRFFYAAFPFFFGGLALWAEANSTPRLATKFKQCFAIFSACLPLLVTVILIGDSTKFAGERAFELANRIRLVHLAGPIAGSGSLTGGRAGLYVSFLLRQPWYGDELNPTVASLKQSGARLVVVKRNSPLAQTLAADGAFTNRDNRLFADGSKPEDFPLQVYEIRDQDRKP